MRHIINGREFDTVICKYRPINEWLFESLREGSLWFADPETFNDRLEVKSYAEVVQPSPEVISSMAQRAMERGYNRGNSVTTVVGHYSEHPEDMVAVVRKLAKGHAENTGICCFSQHDDISPLWAHYADGDRGVCLKFEMTKDWRFFTTPIVIDYVDNIPPFDFAYHRQEPGALVQYFFGTKTSEWRHEKEIRVAKMNGLYPKHRGNILFDKQCLVEVVFGARTAEDKIQEIIGLMAAAGYQSSFCRMVMAPGSTGLIKVPV